MGNMYDDIPSTEQGIIIYQNYCIKKINQNGLENKRLYKIIEECDKRKTNMTTNQNKEIDNG